VHIKLENNEVTDVKIHGEALTDRIYNVAIPDYVANGGSDCLFLKGCDRTVYSELLRDMMIDKAAKEKVISAKIEGRIVN